MRRGQMRSVPAILSMVYCLCLDGTLSGMARLAHEKGANA